LGARSVAINIVAEEEVGCMGSESRYLSGQAQSLLLMSAVTSQQADLGLH